jgi:Uma2 family endonuclease
VADTSLDYDRLTKALLYAQAGIAVYWLLDLGGRRMLCHRLPAASGYQQATELSAEAVLELDGVSGWSLAIEKILGD